MTRAIRLSSDGTLREFEFSEQSQNILYHQEYRPITATEWAQSHTHLYGFFDKESVILSIAGVWQYEGIDYTVEETNTGLKINFINDLAHGGPIVIKDELLFVRCAIQTYTNSFTFHKLNKTLTPEEISNGFFDIPGSVIGGSEKIVCGGVIFAWGIDYTLEDLGSSARVVLLGDHAQGGAAPLDENDLLQIIFATES